MTTAPLGTQVAGPAAGPVAGPTAVPVRTTAPPPRWAWLAAHVAALTALPSGLWRLALVVGFPAGYTARGYAGLDLSGWGTPYLVLLSVLSEAAALLTLGLVQRWGEVLPRWVPLAGGRRVPPLTAVVPAGLGAAVVTALWTPLLLWWSVPHDDMTRTGALVVGFLYLPMVAWGPLLAAVTVSYWRRHRPAARPAA